MNDRPQVVWHLKRVSPLYIIGSIFVLGTLPFIYWLHICFGYSPLYMLAPYLFWGTVYDSRMEVIIKQCMVDVINIDRGPNREGWKGGRQVWVEMLLDHLGSLLCQYLCPTLFLWFSPSKAGTEKISPNFCVACQVLEHDTFRSLSEDIIMTQSSNLVIHLYLLLSPTFPPPQNSFYLCAMESLWR